MINRRSTGVVVPESAVPEPAGREIPGVKLVKSPPSTGPVDWVTEGLVWRRLREHDGC